MRGRVCAECDICAGTPLLRLQVARTCVVQEGFLWNCGFLLNEMFAPLFTPWDTVIFNASRRTIRRKKLLMDDVKIAPYAWRSPLLFCPLPHLNFTCDLLTEAVGRDNCIGAGPRM